MHRLIPVVLLALVLCVPTTHAAPSSADGPIGWFDGLWSQLTGWVHDLATTFKPPVPPLDEDSLVIIPIGSTAPVPAPTFDEDTVVIIPAGLTMPVPEPPIDEDTVVIIPAG
ncbi:MAG: hypothetical protein AAF772_04000 [Acidobacteriota bacterium]